MPRATSSPAFDPWVAAGLTVKEDGGNGAPRFAKWCFDWVKQEAAE
jgi:hypothetical protein